MTKDYANDRPEQRPRSAAMSSHPARISIRELRQSYMNSSVPEMPKDLKGQGGAQFYKTPRPDRPDSVNEQRGSTARAQRKQDSEKSLTGTGTPGRRKENQILYMSLCKLNQSLSRESRQGPISGFSKGAN
jgi:hypothetical protein